jgi:hypothetical protein
MIADADFVAGYDSVTSGAAILDDVERYVARFVAYPSEHARVAHVLWCAHAHGMHIWDSTPRLAFMSKEPQSGKSRALELTVNLVPNPVQAFNNSPAYLFRKVSAAEDGSLPTILYDEIDALFNKRGNDGTEDVRAFLNAGHRRGAVAGRCVKKANKIEIEELPAYCAVAVAGLGGLPDTIGTRSVIVRMQRRAKSEIVEQYRQRLNAVQGYELRDRLAAWVTTNLVSGVYPELPAGVEDRAADVWEPLLTVADVAGGKWPNRARVAAVALVAQGRDESVSFGITLLSDVRSCFGDASVMSTEMLLSKLNALEEAPWAGLKGGPLDARRLARFLKPYGVSSRSVRIGTTTPKGYTRADLEDPWSRYLRKESATAATSATPPFVFRRHEDDEGEFKTAEGNPLL